MCWNERLVSLAETVAGWSKDPSTKVGAVIARPDNTIASVGYNGFPRGVADDPERYADREEKYALVIHAEVNAIINSREALNGYSVYLTHPPCSNCAAALINSGIAKVIYKKPGEDLISRWGPSLDRAFNVLDEAGVERVEV